MLFMGENSSSSKLLKVKTINDELAVKAIMIYDKV